MLISSKVIHSEHLLPRRDLRNVPCELCGNKVSTFFLLKKQTNKNNVQSASHLIGSSLLLFDPVVNFSHYIYIFYKSLE